MSVQRNQPSETWLTLAEVSQVDHRISLRFKPIMQLAEAFESKQQATELILPTKHTLDGMEAFVEYVSIEDRLAATFGGFPAPGIGIYVRNHATIENRLPIKPAIVDAIQADDCPLKIKANSIGHSHHHRQGFAPERRFIAISRS
jgi:hypothetical protein